MESSNSKPNFMQQLFAHSRRQERKRSRPAVDPVVPVEHCRRDDGPTSNDVEATGQHSDTTHPTRTAAPARSGTRLQRRIQAYLKSHHRAVEQEREYPVVVRATLDGEDTSSASRSTPHVTAHSHSSSSTPPPDSWNQCLPRLLLILALNMQCNLIVESCPSYDQLRAQLLTERQRCLALSQKNAVISNRFRRFQQHVEALRDQYIHLGQDHHRSVSSQVYPQDEDASSPGSQENRPAEGPNRPMAILEASPQSAFDNLQTTTAPTTWPLREVVRKPNPRRVTASPAKILQHLPAVGTVTKERDDRTNVAQRPARTNRCAATVPPASQASHVRSSPSHHRRAVPTTNPVPQGTTPPSTLLHMTTTNELPAWAKIVPSPQEPITIKQQTAPPPPRPILLPHDDSQTIVPPLAICRTTSPSLPAATIEDQDQSRSPHDDTATRTVDMYPDPPPTSSTTDPALNQGSSLPVNQRPPRHFHDDDTLKTGTGWMSTRHAKAFVAEVDNTKLRPEVGPVCPKVPLFKPQGIAHRLTRNSKQTPNHHSEDDDFLDSPSNGNTNQVQPYLEVVRKKEERDRLNRYECVECGKFIEAICDQDSQGVYDRHALLCNSRHRARFTPPQTPEDFWELSFVDERDAKRRRRVEKELPTAQEPYGAAPKIPDGDDDNDRKHQKPNTRRNPPMM